jgi:hypothetical protein
MSVFAASSGARRQLTKTAGGVGAQYSARRQRCLLVSMFLPYWKMTPHAPQYPPAVG